MHSLMTCPWKPSFHTTLTAPPCHSEFEPLLSWGFWVIPHEWTSTDVSLFYSNTRKTECFDEQRGDKCMKLLLGTWYEHVPPSSGDTGECNWNVILI